MSWRSSGSSDARIRLGGGRQPRHDDDDHDAYGVNRRRTPRLIALGNGQWCGVAGPRSSSVSDRRADAVRHELAGIVQLPRLLARLPGLAHEPRGHATPVLVLPGRRVDDLSTLPLRSYLRLLGYRPTGWTLGRNDGDFRRLVPLVSAVAEQLATQTGGPIPLIGQSMGGAMARAVARLRPDVVSQVITLGSPILSHQSREPLPQPLTVIYSESDRVVPPRWAVAAGDGAQVIEVGSTHFSMGVDPDVWAAVADRLALEPIRGGIRHHEREAVEATRRLSAAPCS
jgi:hypothetical protein